MATDSHNRRNKCSKEDHSRRKVKREDAKENGIWKQLTDEEYEREKVEIRVHLEVLMELLQRKEKDQKYGYIMRMNVKWYRLQNKRKQ